MFDHHMSIMKVSATKATAADLTKWNDRQIRLGVLPTLVADGLMEGRPVLNMSFQRLESGMYQRTIKDEKEGSVYSGNAATCLTHQRREVREERWTTFAHIPCIPLGQGVPRDDP